MKVPRIRDAQDKITPQAVEDSATNLVPRGSILVVTRSGILAHSLPVAVTEVPVALNQDLKALLPHRELNSDYIALALQTFAQDILHSCTKEGTTVASVEMQKLLAYAIPLAPVAEQTRIVEAVHAAVSHLDEAVQTLHKNAVKLTVYRAAVLRAACEGRLVPTEAELARAEGRLPEEFSIPGGRPASVEGWHSAPISAFAQTSSGGTPLRSRPELFHGTIPWVKSGELRDGIVLSTEECISEQALAESSAKLFPRGTLCVALYGATVGKIGILGLGAATNQAVCGIFLPQNVDTRFMFHVLRARRSDLIRAGQGGAQPNISQAIIRAMVVQVPPPSEQRRIVAEVERRLSVVERLETAVEENLARAKRLRQAILKRAFEGRLVPQDPRDEPAAVLLERIRKEREAAGAMKPKGRRQRVNHEG